MASNGDAIRRANVSKKRSARKNTVSDDASRRKDRRRVRRIREKRNRRAALIFASSLMFFAAVAFVCFRPKKERFGPDTERYIRAKALRDAALAGTSNKISEYKRESGVKNDSGKLGLRKVKDFENMRYFDPRQLPPLPGEESEPYYGKGRRGGFEGDGDDAWQSDTKSSIRDRGPKVDYTKHKYEYPKLMFTPPNDGTYPPLEKMSTIFETWGQDDLDSPPETLIETLQHFDFLDPEQVQAATKYRDLELPFKVYNVPEVVAANSKWTDEYLAAHFNGDNDDDDAPESRGSCSESVDSFFAFHRANLWNVDLLGPPPGLDLDWSFDKWAKHSVYADEVGLPAYQKHYYFQGGVPREERHQHKSHWTFVSRDLPSFSSPQPTFFGFNPPEQKGIQCRFGERGVTAATHYDGGRNMIAMITGAKRYILSPPIACPSLGLITSRKHPSYRHSMLNFGRITLLNVKGARAKMSDREKEWLKIAADAPTLSTVLKAGEVLYVPSHWFHYIVSLQKSGQCNTRSGIHEEGNRNFGGLDTVLECIGNDE